MQKVNKAKKRAEHADPTADEAIKKALRSQKARQSRETGAMFEKMIDNSVKWYEAMGEACIEKTPEPMRPLRPPNARGQFLACFTKQAQPDYQGTLSSGRSVVFEAKHTDGEKIEYSRLSGEQIDRLEQHYKMGAEVFVLVSVGLVNFYRVPWIAWRSMLEMYGRRHMKLYELERYRVPFTGGVIKLLEGIDKEDA